MSTWYTAPEDDPTAQERVRDAWHEAPLENLEVLGFILGTAKKQVLAYAPAPTDTDDLEAEPPDNYVYAQLEQAKNLWNAGRVDSNGNVGSDQFTFTPRPLDWVVKAIIRPIDGKPDVY